MHGEQNGSVYQEVTLCGTDVAPVSPLAEDRAGGLESGIHCKHGDHGPHLQPKYSIRGAYWGRGFRPTVSPSRRQQRTRSGAQIGRPCAMDRKPPADNAASRACGRVASSVSPGAPTSPCRGVASSLGRRRPHIRPLLAGTDRGEWRSLIRGAPGAKRLCRGAKLFDRRIHRHRPPGWYVPPSAIGKQEVASEGREELSAP